MSDTSLKRLRALAVVWDDLARIHSGALFNTEFLQDLERLNHFQDGFPEKSADLLVTMLEHKVLKALSQRHSEKEIWQAGARLAQPDTEEARSD